jgi:hypothetical protein
MVKLADLFVGGWITITGLFLIFGKEVFHRGFLVDFGEGNIVVGFIFLAIGVGILITSFRRKAKEFEEKFLICTSCKTPFKHKEIKSDRCECGGEFEDLDGFYKRNPKVEKSVK